MDGANLFTLVANIKVSPHSNEFTFEGGDTELCWISKLETNVLLNGSDAAGPNDILPFLFPSLAKFMRPISKWGLFCSHIGPYKFNQSKN